MLNFLADANSAFVDEDYVKAISLYAQAIESDPSNPSLFTSRAQAQIKVEDFMAAVESCNQAIKLDASNFKAHFRRGVACWHLEEPETALEAFQRAQKLESSNGQISDWVTKCHAQLAEETGQGSRGAVEHPPASAAASAQPPQQQTAVSSDTGPGAAVSAASVPAEAPQPLPELPKPSKYRHQWLQTQKMVEVSIFAKKLTAERLSITIDDKRLQVTIRDTEGKQEYEMDVHLFSRVDSAASRWEVLGTKVEVILTKADPSVSWPTLESSDSRPAANWSLPEPPRSSYPTSSKSTVDWDKLEAEMKEEEKKEVLDGDAGIQKLFKDIYGGADEDTRRAMNKSYQESNGTALSTNWGEIGSKKTEWTPPENADVKKWES